MFPNIVKRVFSNSSYKKNTGLVDLHIHSNFSDGSFSPLKILRLASKLGLRAISITDHDNIDAIPLALNNSSKYKIEFIPGIEISAKQNNYDLHLLGYFIDYNDPNLNKYVQLFQEERRKRAEKIVALLNSIGLKIDFELVQLKSRKGSIGRPHIADVLIDKGYVSNREEAFVKYIGDGCPCYVPKFKISPTEAIKLIKDAGGISFVAHPGLDLNEKGILELIEFGIEGIETIHPKHCQNDIYYYQDIVKKYKLLESGGSDCHGNGVGEMLLGTVEVPYITILAMKEKLNINSKI